MNSFAGKHFVLGILGLNVEVAKVVAQSWVGIFKTIFKMIQ